MSDKAATADELLHAIRDAIEHLQENGAGDEIKGHKDGYPTSCLGGPLYAWTQNGAPRPGGKPATPNGPVVVLSKVVAAAKADPPKKGTPAATTEHPRKAPILAHQLSDPCHVPLSFPLADEDEGDAGGGGHHNHAVLSASEHCVSSRPADMAARSSPSTPWCRTRAPRGPARRCPETSTCRW